jgi:nucleoredoxin
MSEEIKRLFGDKVTDAKNAEISTDELKDKIIGVYFSAHWCSPCRVFTPLLSKTYQDIVKNNKPFEVVFVSSDDSEANFKEYLNTMPWKAVPFQKEDMRTAIAEKFGIRGIPALIVLNSEGKVISKDGRVEVMKSKEKVYDTWITSASAEK